MTSFQRVCFGIPSVFSFSSKTCSTCGDFDKCRDHSYQALKGVAQTPSIMSALIEHERFLHPIENVPDPVPQATPAANKKKRPSRAKQKFFELTDMQQAMIEALPEKAREFARKIFKRGHDALIRAALRKNEVPLEGISGYRSLKVALRLLNEGFDRQTLRVAFSEELGWSYRSAWNEVSLMWAVLPAIGVAHEKRGRLVVAPSITGNNQR